MKKYKIHYLKQKCEAKFYSIAFVPKKSLAVVDLSPLIFCVYIQLGTTRYGIGIRKCLNLKST